MGMGIPAYIRARKFLIDKLGYAKEEVIAFERFDNYQTLKFFNTINAINRNVRNTARLDNPWGFQNI